MTSVGKIAVMGGGSWATALAKLLLGNYGDIIWYMRRDDRIESFKSCGHNPAYLSDVVFDTSKIRFTSDINAACSEADTLLLAIPSPYLKEHLLKLSVDLKGKQVVSAIKGIVPGENKIVTDYMSDFYGVDSDRMAVIGGPCHAEEVALDRCSYLTIGSRDRSFAESFAKCLAGRNLHTVVSDDVAGIEYAAVLKNVYGICAGMIYGAKIGDNFLAMTVSTAIREMQAFLDAVCGGTRNICDSVYLGDLLVTAYSKFSRNHNFGAYIGRGYPVKSAMLEMEMIVEGYYGTKCIHEINENYGVDMPILECVYNVLYRNANVQKEISALAGKLS